MSKNITTNDDTDIQNIFDTLLSDDTDTDNEDDDIEDNENEDYNNTNNDDETDVFLNTLNNVVEKNDITETIPKIVNTKIEVKSSIKNLNYANRLGDLTFDNNDIYQKTEFGKLNILYKRVRDPNNDITNYFTSHCNIIGQMNTDTNKPIYHTSKQLSKHYVLMDMETLISTIKSGISITNEDVFVDPFICTWKADTTRSLKTIDNQLEKDLFLLYSGFDSSKIFNVDTSRIELYISNSYDGSSAILSSFAFYMLAKDDSGKLHKFRDFFSIREKKNKFLHKGIQVTDIQESLINIDRDITNDINIMKKEKLSEDDLNSIASKFQKHKAKNLRQRHEKIPEKYNNVYFSLLMVSSILNEEYKTSEHFNVQPIINKILKKVFEKHHKKSQIV